MNDVDKSRTDSEGSGHSETLKAAVSDFMVSSIEERYSYNFTWMGRPIIQYPQDMVAMQELIWRVKPEVIIETGIAHGGSLVFHASMLELMGGNGKVIGVREFGGHHT
jgi:cephalosporin hydroxylase